MGWLEFLKYMTMGCLGIVMGALALGMAIIIVKMAKES
jgi:hypothetical protein